MTASQGTLEISLIFRKNTDKKYISISRVPMSAESINLHVESGKIAVFCRFSVTFFGLGGHVLALSFLLMEKIYWTKEFEC